MAVCDKWVALKIVEFLGCVACIVAKRVADDDQARLELLQQKLSREWSLLRSVTWDALGGSFADAIYGGYTIITFGLLLGRVCQEVPRGRRVLEGFFLGMGMIFFLVLGGLELASLDFISHGLIVNAAVLGTLSLVVAALFLVDLMGPRITTASNHSQTLIAPVSPAAFRVPPSVPAQPAPIANGHANGFIPGEGGKDTTKDIERNKLEKISKKDESILFESPKHGYTKFDDGTWEKDALVKSKYGSFRKEGEDQFDNGNYVRLSDPLAEPDRLHYERELAKFNERYLRDYLDSGAEPRVPVREDFLPELQTPVFAKVKSGRLKSLYEDVTPSYGSRRTKSPPKHRSATTPTLHQLEEYLRSGAGARTRVDTPAAIFPMEPIEEGHSLEGRASGTPTDPGYVQYAAQRWPDKRDARTPRHSPTQ